MSGDGLPPDDELVRLAADLGVRVESAGQDPEFWQACVGAVQADVRSRVLAVMIDPGDVIADHQFLLLLADGLDADKRAATTGTAVDLLIAESEMGVPSPEWREVHLEDHSVRMMFVVDLG